MITDKNFKDVISGIMIIGLFILAAIILKPVAIAIIFGVLLAYILYPVYRWLLTKINSENISALIICLGLLIIIILATSLILSSLVKQAMNLYLA
ncbi:unnamed protein product, partial [marine sediment metagenome]